MGQTYEEQLLRLGYKRYVGTSGICQWVKNGKCYIWNGNYNKTATGIERNLQEVSMPSNYNERPNYDIKDKVGKPLGTFIHVGGTLFTLVLWANFGSEILIGKSILSILSNIKNLKMVGVGIGLLVTLLSNQKRSEALESSYKQAQSTRSIVVDPILIDLNNDGIRTTSLETYMAFDYSCDGFAEKSAWVDENDGILVIDKNNDGIINNGSEIFGENYIKANGANAADGFDALRDLDSNNDGIISADDAEFNNIKILKGDGSLISLDEVRRLGLDPTSIKRCA